MKKHEHANTMTDRVAFGLWIYILSDAVIFAALFATYAVQQGQTFGGPGASDIFSLPKAFIETLLLLTSSFTCGLAVLAANDNKKDWALTALAATLILGLAFVGIEFAEFRQLVLDGHGWQQSSFLTSFFTLVGTHGLHVTLGALWILVIMAHVWIQGLTEGSKRKLLAFSIFWHFLDIIWIFIFTFVYLFGVM